MMDLPLTLAATGGHTATTTGDTQAIQPILPLGQGNREVDGLYVHIPFCFHKCHYCDFYSIADPSGLKPDDRLATANRHADFVARLIGELKHRSVQMRLRPRTIFAGGGTPTLLSPDLWRLFLAALHRIMDFRAVQEFTVEANPETVTPTLLEVLAAGGVNRLSIGAQSFDPQLLKTLERWHDPANVGSAIKMARAAGIQNVNVDMIFAIPGQTLKKLDADLDAVLALGPDHLSCYGLTYEPHTALTSRLGMGKIVPLDEEFERQMYDRVMTRLDTAGFEQYEISNWARPNRRCQHNLAYWHNQNWLAVGPSAASHIDGYRWKNKAHLGQYLSHWPEPPTTDHEHLSPPDRVGEQLMLKLRLREGVKRKWLLDHLSDDDRRHGSIADMVQIGLLEWVDVRLRLTRRGLFVADSVIGKLL